MQQEPLSAARQPGTQSSVRREAGRALRHQQGAILGFDSLGPSRLCGFLTPTMIYVLPVMGSDFSDCRLPSAPRAAPIEWVPCGFEQYGIAIAPRLGLLQLRLEWSRIDLRQHVAGADILPSRNNTCGRSPSMRDLKVTVL